MSLEVLLAEAAAVLAEGRAGRNGPLPPGGPAVVSKLVDNLAPENLLPGLGVGDVQAVREIGRLAAFGAADPAHPACAAHLHCPPLPVAVAAEALVAALNQSLDSWDQAPVATELERRVVTTLGGLVGYQDADGGLTSGGTESNLMGLLLARDRAGVPHHTRVFCSERAHFSIQRNAGLLGLPDDAVVAVPANAHGQLDVAALEAALAPEADANLVIVATAGTTDLGSIDPLPDIASLAARHRAWLHVDAAYGGGALFSERLAPLLSGLANADSIALDLHKLGWQPIPAGVFLVRDRNALAPLARTAPYLNPADDERAGYPSRLGHSIRTSRRADAVKLAVTFRAMGTAGLGELVDHCHALANHAADQLAADPRFVLYARPVLTSVVFAYGGPGSANGRLRRRLLEAGQAVIGRTELAGKTWLKLTLLNPATTFADLDVLLDRIAAAGQSVLVQEGP